MRMGGDHRNIVQFVDMFSSDTHFYLVMEMASGGELFDRLVTRGPYTELQASALVRELAEALAYLHQLGIVHFDIKPENILLHGDEQPLPGATAVDDGNGSGSMGGEATSGASAGGLDESTRLTDFGSAFLLSASPAERTPKTGSGTSAYMPPEALAPEGERRPCDAAADMWSLGVVMYILLSGAHPFDMENSASDLEITRRILTTVPDLSGPAWSRISCSGRNLLRRLLDKDPARRPTAQEVLQDAWCLASDTTGQGGRYGARELSSLDDIDAVQLGSVPLEDVAENLRKFHRGRRRLKALLLATMLGLDQPHKRINSGSSANSKTTDKGTGKFNATAAALASKASDVEGRKDRGMDDDPLGSRRAAIRIFDRDGKGWVSGADLARVARSVGDADCCDSCVREMIAAVDGGVKDPSKIALDNNPSKQRIRPKQMLKLVPPLCPAQEVAQWDMLYNSGEVDPRACVFILPLQTSHPISICGPPSFCFFLFSSSH